MKFTVPLYRTVLVGKDFPMRYNKLQARKTIYQSIDCIAPLEVTFASESVVGTLVLIAVVTAAVLAGLWYFYFASYNRRRGMNALRFVEAACVGRARVLDAQWLGTSRLRASLRFADRWFENANLTIRLLPRPLPVQWILSCYQKKRETLTFEADLDSVPGMHLEVLRHHWLARRGRRGNRDLQNWKISRPGPVVLTTSTHWQRELPPIINTLMTSHGHHLLSVRFRPESPQLAATIDLDTLTGETAAAGFLGVVRELAAGASTPRQ
jgi:hypothetical protein